MPDAPTAPRRVIFLNRFYWPEEPATAQLLTDLAEALASGGHEVTVITSRPRAAGLPARDAHHGVTILRAGGTRWARLGLPGKLMDFITFYFCALGRLAFTAQRGDTVVALTDPPLLGVGAWVIARLCGARIYHWVQDVYPEVVAVVTGQSLLKVINPLRNLAWRSSDGCVTLGSDMAATLAQIGVPARKITVSSNWAPAGLTFQSGQAADSLRTAWQLEGKFVVVYSGNLGRVHDLAPVLDVADELRGEPGIAFVFIGAGAQRAWLEAEAAKRGLSHVQFHPPQSRGRLAESLALGEVHIVTLLPGCEGFVFPSKLYGVAAVGRPVIFLGPRGCEIARVVTGRGLGRAFTRDETALVAAAIRQLRTDAAERVQFSATAVAFGRDHAGPARAVADWTKLMNSAESR